MEERCKNCRYLKKLYVPPVPMFNEMPKDGYVCDVFGYEGEVMWLGKAKDIELGHCEVFSKKGEAYETAI